MERVFDRVVGLDVHKDTVVACVRLPRGDGGRTAETATFGTTTADLLGLRDWLTAHQVQVVGMESTGVYWKPVFYLLEDDVECWLPTPGTCVTYRAARPMLRTRRGSRSWSSTAWSTRVSCRPSRSGSCAT